MESVSQVKKAKKVAGLVANVDGVSAYETRKGVRFLAQVRLAGRKAKSKSFADREAAKQWKREQEADVYGDKKLGSIPDKLTMGELFSLYVDLSERHGSPLPAHQVMMFDRLKAHPLLKDVKVAEIDFGVVRDYCSARKNVDSVCPSTILSEFARINVSIERCADWLEWGENFIHPLTGARKKLMNARLIGESKERDRRPSPEEMGKLVAYFKANPSDIPMADIVCFAALNAFRRGEIPMLLWSKLDVANSAIVSMRKDSSLESEGGKRKALVPVLPAAMEIIQRQPRIEGEDRIFPYGADAMTRAFLRACRKLKIEDLRFHDLRHEAISTAAQVLGDVEGMEISGHKTHRHYKRYVNFQPEDAKRIAAKTVGITPAWAAQ